MIYKKRGQITLFVIIGLIIIFTFFILSYYRKESIEETELIMPELIPIQQYVMSCTKSIGEEAIDIIGLNGGYIFFPQWIQNNPNSYLKLSPIDDLKNPFWWYDGKVAVPPLDFIEKQIEDYIKQEMPDCIDNFSAFHNQYNVIELGEFNVIAEIGEEDVTVKTIYPLEIQDKFNKTLAELQKFPVTIPIRLKKVHTLAAEIMERENIDFFIEKKAIDLISLDDDEIPTIGIDIDCKKKEWQLSEVENKLKQLLQANLPYIKIKGTNFNPNSIITPYLLQDTNPYSESNTYNESYYYNHYIWDVTDTNNLNMNVAFNYDSMWPINLYVRPNKGSTLQSNSQKSGGIMSLFCLHVWHFTYDVIFPVKVTIVDDETESNDRYSFSFAFKANINHNTPDRTNFAIASFETGDKFFEEEYCKDLTNEITVFASDKVTSNFISKVNLTMTCGRYTCNLGATKSYWDLDPSGTPKLIVRVPYCSNAVLKGVRSDYEEGQIFANTGRRLDTAPEKRIGGVFNLELRPVKEFNYTVVKHKLLGAGISGAKPLGSNEKAMITIRNDEENFESHGTYPLDQNIPLKLLSKDDYDYDLEIFMMDDVTITGGYKTQWTVTHVDTRLGSNITFHVVEKDFKDDQERFAFFAGLKKYSEQAPLPEIK